MIVENDFHLQLLFFINTCLAIDSELIIFIVGTAIAFRRILTIVFQAILTTVWRSFPVVVFVILQSSISVLNLLALD